MALQGWWPASITYQVQAAVEEFDETNGQLIGESSQPTAASTAVGGTSASSGFASGTGAYVTWRTSGIVNNRRVKGRTFVCPIVSSAYDGDGSLSGQLNTMLQSAGDGLITQSGTNGTPLVVWRRPHQPSQSDPRPGYSGQIYDVTQTLVKDRVTSLRTRRS